MNVVNKNQYDIIFKYRFFYLNKFLNYPKTYIRVQDNGYIYKLEQYNKYVENYFDVKLKDIDPINTKYKRYYDFEVAYYKLAIEHYKNLIYNQDKYYLDYDSDESIMLQEQPYNDIYFDFIREPEIRMIYFRRLNCYRNVLKSYKALAMYNRCHETFKNVVSEPALIICEGGDIIENEEKLCGDSLNLNYVIEKYEFCKNILAHFMVNNNFKFSSFEFVKCIPTIHLYSDDNRLKKFCFLLDDKLKSNKESVYEVKKKDI